MSKIITEIMKNIFYIIKNAQYLQNFCKKIISFSLAKMVVNCIFKYGFAAKTSQNNFFHNAHQLWPLHYVIGCWHTHPDICIYNLCYDFELAVNVITVLHMCLAKMQQYINGISQRFIHFIFICIMILIPDSQLCRFTW